MGLFNIQETQCIPLHGLDPMNPSSRFFLCPSCNRVLPGFVLQIACQPILQTFHHLFVQAVLGREHKKRPTCSDEFPQPVGTRRLESREKISRRVFPQIAKLLGFLLQVCVLEQACWCRCRCRCKVLLDAAWGWPLELGCWRRCRVLLSKCCLRFGAWLLVPLQGAAAGHSAACRWCRCRAECRCRVPLQSAAAKRCCQSAVCALSFVACAVRCKVLLSKRCLRFGAWLLVPLQGAASGCHFRVPLLWSAAHGFFCGIWGLCCRNYHDSSACTLLAWDSFTDTPDTSTNHFTGRCFLYKPRHS